jgi:hypothetical protein
LILHLPSSVVSGRQGNDIVGVFITVDAVMMISRIRGIPSVTLAAP